MSENRVGEILIMIIIYHPCLHGTMYIVRWVNYLDVIIKRQCLCLRQIVRDAVIQPHLADFMGETALQKPDSKALVISSFWEGIECCGFRSEGSCRVSNLTNLIVFVSIADNTPLDGLKHLNKMIIFFKPRCPLNQKFHHFCRQLIAIAVGASWANSEKPQS